MAIDLTTAAANALVAWAATVDDVAAARLGWPEHQQELNLSSGNLVTVEIVGQPERNDCTPRAVSQVDNGDGTLDVTYIVGRPVITVRLDVWSAYKAQREIVVASLEAAFEPAVPRPGLWLTSSGYFDRPITARVVAGPRYFDEGGDAAVQGEWRASYSVELHTDRVQVVTHTKQQQVDLKIQLEVDGETTTETISTDLSGA